MSELDRLVNACLMPAFQGPTPPRWLHEHLADGLGGVIIFGPQLVGGVTVSQITATLREWQPDLLVALDEEGGDVTRLDYLTGSRYPGNLALGVVDDEQLTYDVARAMAEDLAAASVNLNFAPSVDVNSNPENPVIGVRSFGSDPERVAAHGVAYIRAMEERRIATSPKHFPGHGDTRDDSHHALPVIDCDLETFRRRELLPFVAAIEAGAQTIMTAHVVFSALDDQPATLSRRILTGLLREELGYDGVIVTDALDMAGVSRAHGIAGAAVLSLKAGADILLIGSEEGDVPCANIRRAVADAVAAGELDVARLEEAAARVQRLREWAAPGPYVAADVRAGVGLEAARRAIRTTGRLPLPSPAFTVELRAGTNPAVGEAHWSLIEALEGLGFAAGSMTVVEGGASPEEVISKAGDAPLVVAVRDAYRQPWQGEWLSSVLAARPDAVVVAIGMPDDRAVAGDTLVLTHGAGVFNIQAAAEVLSGRS